MLAGLTAINILDLSSYLLPLLASGEAEGHLLFLDNSYLALNSVVHCVLDGWLATLYCGPR